ncbi:MAG: ATP-binding protein [Akkermansiaceae bacterium]|jgi:predicted AAA+ superfamily ATPase
MKRLLENFPAVVLIGPRQVGKTTLAHTIEDEEAGLYLDLESNRDLRRLSDPEDYLARHEDELVILDEIQRVPYLFTSLRGLIDQGRRTGRKNGRYLLLGSASLELIQQSSETLAGRIAYLELHPLDLTEVGSENLDRLWYRGGFPESYLSQNDQTSAEQRDFLIRSYLEAEIPKYGGRLAGREIRNLWTMLAHQQGGMLNVADLSRNLDLDARTINGYLGLLEDLLLIRTLKPWFKNVGKRLVKSPKFYIRDSGIVHELLGISGHESLLGHPVVGGSWEGFVIENLLALAPPRTEAYFYRTSAGAEVDLVLCFRDQTRWVIEIKRGISPNITPGFYNALEDLKPDKSFIVYGGDDRFKVAANSEMISLPLLQAELLGKG